MRLRVTRDLHRVRLADAEAMLFDQGWHPTQAARKLAVKHECSVRQAHRYVATVRALYRQGAANIPAHNIDETVALLHALSAQAKQGADPDYKASIKAIELACRLRGWLDRKSTVTVDGSVQVTHALQHKVDALSTAERLALAAFQLARDLRVAGVVDAECVPVAERSGDARVAPDSTSAAVPLARLTDGET